MELIDKSTLVAEIEKRLKANGAFDEVGDEAWAEDKGMCEAYRSILSFLDTLEVKDVGECKKVIPIEDIENAAARYDGSMSCVGCFIGGAKWMEQRLKEN